MAFGVGNKPNSVSPVWRVDTCSRKYKRLYLVAFSFQVSAHLLEYHAFAPINNSANVFAHHVAWLNLLNCSKLLRPQVAWIVNAFLLAGSAVWLAGETSCEHVNFSAPNREVCCGDVCILCCFRKMVFQYLSAPWVNFAIEGVLPAHPLCSQVKTANTCKKACVYFLICCFTLQFNCQKARMNNLHNQDIRAGY